MIRCFAVLCGGILSGRKEQGAIYLSLLGVGRLGLISSL